MDLFASLRSFFKTQVTTIDNNIFRLHYKFTGITLVAFSILVTARQYIGDPIDCISKDDIPPNLLDTYCWVTSTFSLPKSWEKKVGIEVPYPGVDKYTPGEKRVYHAYYQWVCFVLFFQAILFYLPRYLWRMAEAKRMKNLVLSLDMPCLEEETRTKNRKILVEYLLDNLKCHGLYVGKYITAEVLNFINVVGQIFLMDKFLGGEFSKYGLHVIQFTGWDGSLRYDPMIKVFPRLTKCTFHRYGSSGDVQRHDAMCILPINIINEKIYIFLWFWFIVLSVLSALVLVYRAVLFFWPRSRFLVTSCRAKLVNQSHLESVIGHCKLGDWFVLDLLAKNLDPLNFRDVIADMAKKIDGKAFDDYHVP